METRTVETASEPKLDRIAGVLRIGSWLSLWGQLLVAGLVTLLLGLAIAGRQFSQTLTPIFGPGVVDTGEAGTPGVGIAIFWAIASLLVLLFGVFVALRQTRFAKRLGDRNPTVHPRKREVTELLRLAAMAGLAGILLGVLGGGAALGVMLSKTVIQPQGVAIYDPNRIIRSLDVFVSMSNLSAITGNLIGTIASLSLLNWLHR